VSKVGLAIDTHNVYERMENRRFCFFVTRPNVFNMIVVINRG